MTDKEPSKEQIREFWEWCGLKWFWNHNPKCDCGAIATDSDKSWHYFSDGEYHLATRFWHEPMQVDHNNMFKYAVPKLKAYHLTNLKDGIQRGNHLAIVWVAEPEYYRGIGETPALALFWAIWEAIKKCQPLPNLKKGG